MDDTDILLAGDEYQRTSKAKYLGVISYDFLAGARWMEKHIEKGDDEK